METNMNGSNASKNVLNSDVEIKGHLKFAGELTFEGKLDGEINTDGTLTLGDSAVITGNISAKEKVEIKAKAEVFGDIRATKLAIEEGVTFVGKTEVNPNKVAPTVPTGRLVEPLKIPETPVKAAAR